MKRPPPTPKPKSPLRQALLGLLRSAAVSVAYSWAALIGAGGLNTMLRDIPALEGSPLAELTITFSGTFLAFAFWFVWEYPLQALFILLAFTIFHWCLIAPSERVEAAIVEETRVKAKAIIKEKKRKKTGRRR